MSKLLFSVSLLLLSLCSFAQDTLNMNEVSILAIRVDNKMPFTSKTITKSEFIGKYQGAEIPVILNKTPSIISSTDGGHPQGYTYYRLRGMDQTRVNVTLNGVILNEPEDQGVYTSNYPMFANNIQSLQIQRGVGTSSNGVSSYAGSLSFQSQAGTTKSTEGQLGYGSWNTSRFSVSNSTGLSKKKFALYANVSSYFSDGYKYNSGGSGYSGFLSGGYYGAKDIIRVTAFSGKSLNHQAWLAVSESEIAKDPRTNFNTRGDRDDFTQSFVQLQYNRLLTKNSRLSLTGFYNRLDGNWDLSMDPDKLNFQLFSNFYGGIANYNLTKKNLRFNAGISANGYERNHALGFYPNTKDLAYTNRGYKNEASAFVKVGYDIKKISLFGDAQYRYVNFRYNGDVPFNNLDWNFFNPKIGVVYTFNKLVNTYFSVGQANREPTRTNLFNGDDNLVSYSGVTREKVLDYELGVNVTKNKLSGQVNIYYMNFNDEITQIGPLGANGLPLMVNVPQSYRSGLELDLKYKFSTLFTNTFNASFSRNRMTYNYGKFQQLYSPSIIINEELGYTYGKLSLSVNAKYHSLSYINFENTATTPSFIIFGSNVSYQFKRIQFLLEGINLTSKRYYTNGYTVGNERYFFVNAPISVYGTVKITL